MGRVTGPSVYVTKVRLSWRVLGPACAAKDGRNAGRRTEGEEEERSDWDTFSRPQTGCLREKYEPGEQAQRAV